MMILAQVAATLAVGVPFPGPVPAGQAFVAANAPTKVEGLRFVAYPQLKGIWLVNDKGYVLRSFPEGTKPEAIVQWRNGASLPIGYVAPDPRTTVVPLPELTAARSWLDMMAAGIRIATQRPSGPARGEKGLLVLFLSSHGPADHLYAERLVSVGETAESTGISMIALFPGKEESKASVARFAVSRGINFPCAIDMGNAYADAFRATRTPEAFLLDKEFKVVYAGAVDSSTFGGEGTLPYLLNAIKNYGQGNKISLPITRAFGTPIER